MQATRLSNEGFAPPEDVDSRSYLSPARTQARAESSGTMRAAHNALPIPRLGPRPLDAAGGRQDVSTLQATAPIMAGLVAAIPRPAPTSLEEFVINDFETFWRWCPAPQDGLHRCALLVKLFDYSDLTRKECKVAIQVQRLDRALRALEVTPTDRVEPSQRVSPEMFIRNVRLRDAVCRMNEVRLSFEQLLAQTKQGRRAAKPIPRPLALWTLTVINQE